MGKIICVAELRAQSSGRRAQGTGHRLPGYLLQKAEKEKGYCCEYPLLIVLLNLLRSSELSVILLFLRNR